MRKGLEGKVQRLGYTAETEIVEVYEKDIFAVIEANIELLDESEEKRGVLQKLKNLNTNFTFLLQKKGNSEQLLKVAQELLSEMSMLLESESIDQNIAILINDSIEKLKSEEVYKSLPKSKPAWNSIKHSIVTGIKVGGSITSEEGSIRSTSISRNPIIEIKNNIKAKQDINSISVDMDTPIELLENIHQQQEDKFTSSPAINITNNPPSQSLSTVSTSGSIYQAGGNITKTKVNYYGKPIPIKADTELKPSSSLFFNVSKENIGIKMPETLAKDKVFADAIKEKILMGLSPNPNFKLLLEMLVKPNLPDETVKFLKEQINKFNEGTPNPDAKAYLSWISENPNKFLGLLPANILNTTVDLYIDEQKSENMHQEIKKVKSKLDAEIEQESIKETNQKIRNVESTDGKVVIRQRMGYGNN